MPVPGQNTPHPSKPNTPDAAPAAFPIAAVLLAAGLSERFRTPGTAVEVPKASDVSVSEAKTSTNVPVASANDAASSNKLIADFRGKPLVSHIAGTLASIGFAARIAVLREPETGLALPENTFREVWNRVPDTSQSLSIRCAVSALPDGISGVLFSVGDQPLIRRATVLRLCDAFLADPSRIVVLAWQGTSGNPCIFPAALLPELASLAPGETGKAVIRRHSELVVTVEAESAEEMRDIDTKAELQRGAFPE